MSSFLGLAFYADCTGYRACSPISGYSDLSGHSKGWVAHRTPAFSICTVLLLRCYPGIPPSPPHPHHAIIRTHNLATAALKP